MTSSNFIFNFTKFCAVVSFPTKLLTLVVLLSTAVKVALAVAKLVILDILFLSSFILALKAVVVAKLVILGMSFLISFILVLRVALVVKLVISGIFFSIFLILAYFWSYTSFLTTSFFTASLTLFKST